MIAVARATGLARRSLLALALAAGLCGSPVHAAPATPDPLPSWNAGPAKSAILGFVDEVTRTGGAAYVKPPERIAVFDNDGTLWAEQPVYFELAFALDEIRRLAPRHPEWKDQEPYRSVLAGDLKGVMAGGEKALLQIVASTHAGMTTDQFSAAAAAWLATARHPTRKVPYAGLVYQPQLELLAYLRAKGFKTFIVSGGGVEFMRVFTERAYGVPPEQVIGSTGIVTFQLGPDGRPQLLKAPKVEFIDDGPGKPVGINRAIGRRPIFAFGNSDGDRQMLEYTMAGGGLRFAGLVHHTDAAREWAYDRGSKIGALDKALDEAQARNWTVVDMQRDWKTVFPPGPDPR